jgi:hypothetical protein
MQDFRSDHKQRIREFVATKYPNLSLFLHLIYKATANFKISYENI